jgi:hypothetical protein
MPQSYGISQRIRRSSNGFIPSRAATIWPQTTIVPLYGTTTSLLIIFCCLCGVHNCDSCAIYYYGKTKELSFLSVNDTLSYYKVPKSADRNWIFFSTCLILVNSKHSPSIAVHHYSRTTNWCHSCCKDFISIIPA